MAEAAAIEASLVTLAVALIRPKLKAKGPWAPTEMVYLIPLGVQDGVE